MRNSILLVAVLVALLAVTGSALAQEEPAITPSQEELEGVGVPGILEKPGYTPEGYGPYAITDEATGVRYHVSRPNEYIMDGLVGTRVIVYGWVLEGYDPPVLVYWWTQEASAGEQPDPSYVQTAGLCYELLQTNPPDGVADGVTYTTHPCTAPSA